MMQRLIIQMASATDLSGQAVQAAAETAVVRALGQADIPAPDLLGVDPDHRLTRITVGVPDPEGVDQEAIAALCDAARNEVHVVEGGLVSFDADSGASQITASAAVEVFLPRQADWVLC